MLNPTEMPAGLPLISHWIGGRALAGSEARLGNVFNPTTGALSARVPFASVEEVNAAVAAAREAFRGWAATPAPRRARVLFRFKELAEKSAEELSRLISREHGKTVSDAHGELQRGLEVVEFACGIPHLLKGEFSENVGSGVDAYSMRQPLGVVAGITPFNFPAMVPMWMFPIAIATGNTFVLKPSERDPSTAVRLGELLKESGLPDGVFNVVHGDKVAVDTLLHHPDVAAVSFVGSTPVARHIYLEGTSHGKRVQALGGAKNHLVVMPDADLEQATDALLGSAFGSAGERCMAISVAVAVGDEIADKLIARLTPRIKALRIGASDDAATEMGPLVTREHLERVRSYIDSGVAEGASLVLDGRNPQVTGGHAGFFLGGSLFDRVRPDMRIYREEIFGPVLAVVRVPSAEAAVRLINTHTYANGTAIFTGSGEAARAFTSAIEIGMVGVNVPIPVPMSFYSFGGWRSSLFGDHHIYGMEGVRFYTRLKCVTERWPTSSTGNAEFTMPVMK
ncbi:MAG TPA: CoA-acylating methylmalonate-semialdehyde dehydrogenase [Steroidobacteraceae bacterium]|nr:CoA-acylating methylmalonate-semialdehyde dehydrogenase [Steroidobacteraceae bacterium]